MSNQAEDSETALSVMTVEGALQPQDANNEQWIEMLEQATPIPNKMIFEHYRDNPAEFRRVAMLMALAFFNRSNKILVDDQPVFVHSAVPLMEESNEKLLQQLEYAEFAGDVPLSEIKDRWKRGSYKIESPDSES
ncbi:MAG TPA: hypothetical protein VK463_03105 [Desulfomonilaceae bacterium]|nr:hypothetical protein [Desulfomonilaceae bacterium]